MEKFINFLMYSLVGFFILLSFSNADAILFFAVLAGIGVGFQIGKSK
jgi:hypothetical protein